MGDGCDWTVETGVETALCLQWSKVWGATSTFCAWCAIALYLAGCSAAYGGAYTKVPRLSVAPPVPYQMHSVRGSV
ncbi:hypothetical protein F5Y10DRAFT_176212 [Nemania abortiva]|nr:hypothetical protein F5Y10DRAFT_176212 [Nemania abortiva]